MPTTTRTKLYPRNLEEKLGFDRIKNSLEGLCASALGKNRAQHLRVSCQAADIAKWQGQVAEFLRLVREPEFQPFPTHYQDLTVHLESVRLPGSVLGLDHLVELRDFLRLYAQMVRETRRNRECLPLLYELSQGFAYEKEILASIEVILDEKGDIRPGVSTELNRIRQEMEKVIAVQDKRFESILRKSRDERWLSAEEQTIRNGRRVLAMLSEHKRKIRGIVHDESNSGKTTFLEPQALVELGNELFDLQQQERKEIYRILSVLAQELRPFLGHLIAYQSIAGSMDLVQGKSSLAQLLGGANPIMSSSGYLELIQAKHPLLVLSFAGQDRQVVPLHISLDQAQRILVISGPNAGGKSICLKTLGLIQLMYQAGMHLPLSPNSSLPVFQKIYLDMGDDQNLDSDLSTYSSHLKALKHFVNHADASTLFLVDEFGAGTDPQYGGAIAEGVLDHLVKSGAYGVVTTHYTNLKLYAGSHPGVANGCMLFDQEAMQPTYTLQIGRPGSSYAFEIAQRIGLNKSVLAYARAGLGQKAESFDLLINRLEKDKVALEDRLREAREKELKYKRLTDEYKELKQQIKDNRNKAALAHKTQLQNELKNIHKKFDQSMQALKSNKKGQDEIAREIRESLKKESEKVDSEIRAIETQLQKPLAHGAGDIQAGQSVIIKGATEVGVVESKEGKYALVAFRHLRSRVPIDQLLPSHTKAAPNSTSGLKVIDMLQDYHTQIDLRGKRSDEAMMLVEKQIDLAVVLGQASFRIIHGKGDGILRKQIATYLKSCGPVVSFEYEHADRGGDGVTIVQL